MGRRIAPQNRSKKLPRGNPFPKGTSGNPDRRFKPGASGNPGGRPKKTPLTDALREIFNDPKVAKQAAEALVEQLKKKNGPVIQAFKEIADRVEGKPTERVELTGEGGDPIQFKSTHIDDRILELIERIKAREKKPR